MKMIAKYVITGVIAFSLVGVAVAEVNNSIPLQSANDPTQMLNLQKPHKNFCRYEHNNRFKHSFAGSWAIALHRTKQLTPAEAKTVANAAVILYGDSSWKVGKITQIPGNNGHQNYQVEITNQNGKVFNTLIMNGINGKILPIQKVKITPMLPLQVPRS